MKNHTLSFLRRREYHHNFDYSHPYLYIQKLLDADVYRESSCQESKDSYKKIIHSCIGLLNDFYKNRGSCSFLSVLNEIRQLIRARSYLKAVHLDVIKQIKQAGLVTDVEVRFNDNKTHFDENDPLFELNVTHTNSYWHNTITKPVYFKITKTKSDMSKEVKTVKDFANFASQNWISLVLDGTNQNPSSFCEEHVLEIICNFMEELDKISSFFCYSMTLEVDALNDDTPEELPFFESLYKSIVSRGIAFSVEMPQYFNSKRHAGSCYRALADWGSENRENYSLPDIMSQDIGELLYENTDWASASCVNFAEKNFPKMFFEFDGWHITHGRWAASSDSESSDEDASLALGHG